MRARTSSLLAAFIVLSVVAGIVQPAMARDLYEDAWLAMAPSAARAASFGDAHLDAAHPAFYSIDRAEYLYKKAEALDPKYPYINHQLARIAFLHGDFPVALAYIDKQIALFGDGAPNSFYVRALIEGYSGDYSAAAKDYEHFLQFDPTNWAAMNDYAWVLLKGGRAGDAAAITTKGLSYFPENPWLLNTNAIALYESGQKDAAKAIAQKALVASERLTQAQWLQAYPGNDPKTAQAGVNALKKSAKDNASAIEAGTSTLPF